MGKARLMGRRGAEAAVAKGPLAHRGSRERLNLREAASTALPGQQVRGWGRGLGSRGGNSCYSERSVNPWSPGLQALWFTLLEQVLDLAASLPSRGAQQGRFLGDPVQLWP